MVKTIYLCGPINGRTDADATNWREAVKAAWPGKCLDPMRRDYRGREMEPGIAAEIVAGDIEDIHASDAVLVFFDMPSVGTAMEVFYAKHNLGLQVVVIDASDKALSPWLTHHSDRQVKTVAEALEYLTASSEASSTSSGAPGGEGTVKGGCAEHDTFRAAKWLDPECADAGCCQSLKFKVRAPTTQERTPLTDAARDVLAERERQVSAEGWTPEHDDEHKTGAMAVAAASYALHASTHTLVNDYWKEQRLSAADRLWPWDREWWKPAEPRRMLVKAGALILAEIERLDRASLSGEGV